MMRSPLVGLLLLCLRSTGELRCSCSCSYAHAHLPPAPAVPWHYVHCCTVRTRRPPLWSCAACRALRPGTGAVGAALGLPYTTASHGASKPSLKRTPRPTPDITAQDLARVATQRSARCVLFLFLQQTACTVSCPPTPSLTRAPHYAACHSRRTRVLVIPPARCAAARAKALLVRAQRPHWGSVRTGHAA